MYIRIMLAAKSLSDINIVMLKSVWASIIQQKLGSVTNMIMFQCVKMSITVTLQTVSTGQND